MVAGYDLEMDVVVAGYGFAGGAAAIAAHDAGASVGLFEKAPHFGGNSILSGGACVVGQHYDATFAYLERTSGNNTDADVLQVFARGMVDLPAKLASMASEVGFEAVLDRRGGTYPFPGSEQLSCIRVTRNPRYKGFPWAKGTKAGGTLFWVLHEHICRRPGIAQYYNAPVTKLITDSEGVVKGVQATLDGRSVLVCARRGVILATGGFEHNLRLREHYMPIKGALAMSPRSLTGDGVLMAQKAGAALWHMWHVHGGYGFKVPGFPVAIRHSFDGFRKNNKPMPWIALDRFGRRFFDEYPPAAQDTPVRAFEYYDPDIQDYPRIPCHLIFDEAGRALGPIGAPKINDSDLEFTWSDDNLAEVASGLIVRADSLAELAFVLGLDAATVEETVARWNESCRLGRDRDFHRPAGTMVPLEQSPFYAVAAWPIITNTQGGPVHNVRQQVVDPYGDPIPRLFKCGELGSIFGHLYCLGGNLSECFIGGEIAGRNAAAEAHWC